MPAFTAASASGRWSKRAERLWLGASYQAQPGLGAITLDGTLSTSMGTAMAHQARHLHARAAGHRAAGLRARPMWGRRTIELRLFGDMTRWSRLQTQCVSVQGQPCAVFPDGTGRPRGGTTIQNIRRRWKDTFGANLGVSVWMSNAVELFAGAGFATAATPDATLDPMMPDATTSARRGSRFAVPVVFTSPRG